MKAEQIQKLVKRLSPEEIDNLKRLQVCKAQEALEIKGGASVLKALEVDGLIHRRGSLVELTHRGKLVARHL